MNSKEKRWRVATVKTMGANFKIYHNLNRYGLTLSEIINLMQEDGLDINEMSVINSVKNINIPGALAMTEVDYKETLAYTRKVLRNA